MSEVCANLYATQSVSHSDNLIILIVFDLMFLFFSFRRHALREHKWELTDDEMKEIYCANETPKSIKLRSRKSVGVENEESD